MATTASSSSISTLFASPSHKTKTRSLLPFLSVSYPWSTIRCSSLSSSVKSLPIPKFQSWRRSKKLFSVSAALAQDEEEEEEEEKAGEYQDKPTPCQLYVCNLPSSCDAQQLEQIFKPFGTVLSAQITRNPETGVSRGSGYVTMSSANEAKTAVSKLDASDFGGRDMRVRFSTDMNLNALIPTRSLIYESPYKIYVGNLANITKPEQLRQFFSQFGTVLSVKVLYDTKGRNNRTFAFVSFSSSKELKDAIYSNGTDFLGRKILVRRADKNQRNEP